MERRTVRIYKAQDGQGRYINKTAKFLQKAQMGAETRTDSVMKNKEIEPIVNYINGALDNDVDPKKIYTSLVNEGLPQQLVYSVLTQLIQQREEEEEEAEQSEEENASKNEQETEMPVAEYQPIGEEQEETEDETSSAMNYFNSYADEDEGSGVMDEEEYAEGGPIYSYDQLTSDDEESSEQFSPEVLEKLSALSDFVSKNEDGFSSFGKDIKEYEGEYTPIEWDALGDGYGNYKKGGSKKNFTKNVLSLLKKQEGGDNEPLGKGNKKDTITDDISERKTAFQNKLKEIATKGAVDSIYEKMMKSNNPELIQSAQELAANRQKNSQMGTFEPMETAQSGGYVGEFQPELFNQGGFDIPQAKKGRIQKFGDFLLGEQYLTANNPYSVTTGALYRDPVSGLTPVARTVHKRGIFGRPKKWTDYYQKGPSNIDQDFINNFTEYKPKESKDKKIKDKNDTGLNKWGFTEEEWDKMSGRERRLERRFARREKRLADEKLSPAEELFLKKQKEEEAWKKHELAMAERFAERYNEEMGINDPNSAYWDNFREEPKEVPLVGGLTDEDIEMIDAANSERELDRGAELQKQAMDRLKAYTADNSADVELAKIRDKVHNQFASLRNFRPDKKAFDAYELKRKAAEDAYNQEIKEKEGRELEEEMQNQEYEKRRGGSLYKAILGVQSPTSTLSGASDPTANTMNLMDVLKPQENPNTFMGVSAPWMNQNIPTNTEAPNVENITMDPNQTKDQKITSLDFGNPDKDNLIAQDVKRKRRFNGVNFNNKLNAAADVFTGFSNRLDSAKNQNEMYMNNFTSDNLQTASTDKDRGRYVALGQYTGAYAPDQTGQESSGSLAYGQRGGYMRDFDYDVDEVVNMTEDELREFIANGGEVEYLES